MVDAVWLILALLGKDEFFCFRFIFQKVFVNYGINYDSKTNKPE